MARIQTSFLDPEQERAEQESAMLAMLDQAPVNEAPPLPPEYAPETVAPARRVPIAPPSAHVARLPPGPGDAEMETLANYQPRPGWQNVLARVGAAIAESTGSPGSIERQHGAERSFMQERAAMLDAARQKDQGELPVDRGTADLLELGGMSPQAAASTTRGSPALKLAQSGMGQLGARYRQQDLMAQQKSDHDAALLSMLRERLGAQKEIAKGKNDTSLAVTDKRTAAQLEAAKIRAHKGGGLGAPLTPEAKAAREKEEQESAAAWLSQQANVPYAKSLSFVQGSTEGIAPEEAERLQVNYAQYKTSDQEKLRRQGLGREGSNPDKVTTSTETKLADPKAQLALKEEVSSVGRDIALAERAWSAMSDDGKQAMAQLGGAHGDLATLVKSARMSPEDQKHAAQIMRMVNPLVKSRGGSAVTESEWSRVAVEIGFPAGDWSVFNSPEVIGDFIQKSKSGWVRRKNTINEVYHFWGKPNGGP